MISQGISLAEKVYKNTTGDAGVQFLLAICTF